MTPEHAATQLIDATMAMHTSGTPLMRRVIPQDIEIRLWDHYPDHDAVSPQSKSRYFYHCHPVEERGADEHGHFHLFLPKQIMPKRAKPRLAPPNLKIKRADVVHIVALSVNPAGLPTAMFTVNRWVTDEFLYPQHNIMAALDGFDLTGADGDPLVNLWLTAMVHLARPVIDALLVERDAALAAAHWAGEDRSFEILSHAPVDLQSLVANV